MNAEESRKQFEAWYWVNYGKFELDMPNVIFAIEDDEYINLGPRMAYDSWQASRENMPKIKLPKPRWFKSPMTMIRQNALQECKQAIIAAGYEVE